MRRRHALLALAAAGAQRAAWPAPVGELRFPRDHGSHPTWATEWWYLTGQVRAEGALWGFQMTFFRSRVDIAAHMRSAFAARQLLFVMPSFSVHFSMVETGTPYSTASADVPSPARYRSSSSRTISGS